MDTTFRSRSVDVLSGRPMQCFREEQAPPIMSTLSLTQQPSDSPTQNDHPSAVNGPASHRATAHDQRLDSAAARHDRAPGIIPPRPARVARRRAEGSPRIVGGGERERRERNPEHEMNRRRGSANHPRRMVVAAAVDLGDAAEGDVTDGGGAAEPEEEEVGGKVLEEGAILMVLVIV
ncbi:hypothetical protein NL676_030524 [Syzygium grande]|nr:hypothetical protein NL676_030524 [Syzygium grande]